MKILCLTGRALRSDGVHVRAEEAGGEELRAEGRPQGLRAPFACQRNHAGDRGIREY